jgi:hypothetical protein
VAWSNLSSVLQITEQLQSHRAKRNPQEARLHGAKRRLPLSSLPRMLTWNSFAAKVMGVATSLMLFQSQICVITHVLSPVKMHAETALLDLGNMSFALETHRMSFVII